MRKNLGENYNPLYFLASLGTGGLSVSFFMYFMFMVDHPGRPMANFEHVFPILTGDNLLLAGLTALAIGGILFFAFKHFRLLFWNIKEYRLFKKTAAYQKLINTPGEISIMAIPLTLAMTVNVMFILGGLFVPNLWSVVEYAFPFALAAFFAVGIYALVIFKNYFTRFIINGDLDFVNGNNLSHMLAIFAFAMIAVGFGAPAAMSHTLAVSVIGTVMAIFFGTLAAGIMVLKLILGFRAIFEKGIDKGASPSLWLAIPIITLFGITFVRLYNGISHNLLEEPNPSALPLFIVLTILVSLQIVFGFIGYIVLKKINYFKDMVRGEGKSPGSFSLICPGVAFFVLGMFWIHWGFTKTGIVTMFSPVYFAMLIPFAYVQFRTIQTILRLSKKLLKEPKAKGIQAGKNQYSTM